MFIDRKINGALIQDLAPREEGGGVQGEEEMEKERWRKERIRQMRLRNTFGEKGAQSRAGLS